MNAGIGIGILFIVCIVAVIATIIYKTRSSGPAASNPETLKFNADGTLSFTESKKEYFYATENVNGTTYTEDDPVHARYYKNKATRTSIWNATLDILQTPCDEPDCVFVKTSDRATTTVLLNDIMDSMRLGLKDYRDYFKSKGINRADYRNKAIAEGEKSVAEREKFSVDILFKGYLEYKGIAVPAELSVSWSEMFMSEFYNDIVIRFPIVKHWMLFDLILMGALGLKEKSDGKTVLSMFRQEYLIGIDMDISVSIIYIASIKSLVENKDIVNILYDPPPVTLSYKQIQENMTKKSAAMQEP
jgi:hypothetical protein